ncbi:response regulator [Noviherbaspirillum saxi]|uniref:Response regulator n=1 Tax=Noviherbaspirillum saxi TaxID=2320863 RepID=A0A3A3FTP1_9BURK|nr:response regulator [Noviherbaspirillum saxi]RJF98890.1 response regulator [Noviherbaspirillum saxi]
MPTPPAVDISLKPRVLIADDSRIVRATLIKHIEGMFDFREALNGEEAWETLLIDPNIRVVITDLSMPKLDGYGLLQRIRNSKITRIREIPVVVVSGSDERAERERAKAAGATDLITKGIGTPQLLSRLDILSKLVATQREFERSLEALIQEIEPDAPLQLPTVEAFRADAAQLLDNAARNRKNFVLLDVSIGLKHAGLEGAAVAPPSSVAKAIGRLLRRTIRDTDHLGQFGDAEFVVATGSINFDSARLFAQRVCRAIASAHLASDERMSFIASCGVASLSDPGIKADEITFDELLERARHRALLGIGGSVTGVVGPEEEAAVLCGEQIPSLATAKDHTMEQDSPDLATLLQWIREGRQDEVLPHLGRLSAELQPLVDLVLKRSRTAL